MDMLLKNLQYKNILYMKNHKIEICLTIDDDDDE
jgi:hypothetical protein